MQFGQEPAGAQSFVVRVRGQDDESHVREFALAQRELRQRGDAAGQPFRFRRARVRVRKSYHRRSPFSTSAPSWASSRMA